MRVFLIPDELLNDNPNPRNRKPTSHPGNKTTGLRKKGTPKHITLSPAEYRRFIKVLRLKTGDSFPGRDREGRDYTLTITGFSDPGVSPPSLTVSLSPRKSAPSPDMAALADPAFTADPAAVQLMLMQCMCKGKKMDLIVRQAAEAGVSRFVPLESSHAVADPSEKRDKKQQRWDKIAREAMQQCGSFKPMEVFPPLPFKELGSLFPIAEDREIRLFFHQEPLANSSLHEYLKMSPSKVALLIGPEGGLSNNEIQFLGELKFMPVYLETNVLRAETAALYATGAVQTILSERKSWQIR